MVTKAVILSVPYCEPYPMVAPVLLSACLTQAGMPSIGVDFAAQFLKHFQQHPEFPGLKNLLTLGHVMDLKLSRRLLIDVLKFTKQFLQNLIKQHSPEYIGLSIFTAESLDFGLLMCYVLRKHFGHVKIMAGGKGLEVTHTNNVKHYDIWSNNKIVDLIIVGDAENEVVESLRDNKSGIVFAKQQTKQDLDNIPFPSWSQYDLDCYKDISAGLQDHEPYMSVTGSKGCVRQCTFCDVSSFWPEFIYRDPVKIANEIIHNYRKTGIKKFVFTDNLINGSISGYREMNRVLTNTIPRTIRYNGYAIFRGKHQMPDDDFRLAAEAGCYRWSIGVESGSERVRYDMKKKFNNDDLDWSARTLHKYNIQQSWLLMVGYPSESEQDFVDTKQLLINYASLAQNNMIVLGITPTFALLNNSPLLTDATMASSYGLEHNVNHNTNNKFWTSTKFIDNDYPTRARRFRELVTLAQDLGYSFNQSMPLEKYHTELTQLDQIYHDTARKVFILRQDS